jgi:hypothetical protein
MQNQDGEFNCVLSLYPDGQRQKWLKIGCSEIISDHYYVAGK